MKRKMLWRRVASLAAAGFLLGGLSLFVSCFFTAWDGKWVLGWLFILGFVGLTAWTDGPELTR